jgi:hypothetical protein
MHGLAPESQSWAWHLRFTTAHIYPCICKTRRSTGEDECLQYELTLTLAVSPFALDLPDSETSPRADR